MQEALTLAPVLAHPHSLGFAHHWATLLAHRRREVPAVQAHAEALLALATAQGFSLYVAFGTFWRGWALVMQDQGAAGLAQMHEGLAAAMATGTVVARPLCLVPLAEALGHTGQVAEGRDLLAEALVDFEGNGQGYLLAEAYWLQGALLLRHAVPDVGPGRRLLPAGPRRGAPSAGQILGAAGSPEPGAAVAAAGEARHGL